jgi:electron-transferring-flavoprotein dehydrogenase
MEKIKGIHYGILSGMAAADAVAAGDLSVYDKNLEVRGVLPAMRHARNFRAVFQAGLFAGAPLSMVQSFWPWRINMLTDAAYTKKGARLNRDLKPAIDRERLAYLSGTMHREDEPSHLIIPDAAKCRQCEQEFQSPCTTFCPTEVYRRKGDAIQISATNCVHCGTCSVKCPFQNIIWTTPEGGEGPRYKMM